jgi:prephenate dehydratase
MSSAASELGKIAIQGERGSNSHMAALEMLGADDGALDILPCTLSSDVIDAVLAGRVDGAVLPIENSLHGSVAEHYDLLLEHAIRIDRESMLRIRHNLIVAPGVPLADVRRVLSHPVALSQCRHFLAAFSQIRPMPFYDTAGSVKYLMAEGLGDTAGIAPALAAEEYGANVLIADIEDNAENFTRFHLLRRGDSPSAAVGAPNKLSLAFAVEHRPGTLVAALQLLADSGVDLTKIESRPVPGSPWEYIFYVDFRFTSIEAAERALAGLKRHCWMVKELGRYAAARR